MIMTFFGNEKERFIAVELHPKVGATCEAPKTKKTKDER
jgi:hypothetical protein